MSRSLGNLRKGKFFSAWIEKVKIERIPGQDRGRAVALVHVAVHDRHAPDAPLGLHHARRDRRVVEHAEALAVIRPGVMRAARQIGRQPIGERRAAGRDRAAHRAPRALHHLRGPGEADPADFPVGELTRHQARQVIGRVRQPELVVRGRIGHAQVRRAEQAGRDHALAQQGVLAHREAVAFRQGQHEVVAVEKLHSFFVNFPRSARRVYLARSAMGRGAWPQFPMWGNLTKIVRCSYNNWHKIELYLRNYILRWSRGNLETPTLFFRGMLNSQRAPSAGRLRRPNPPVQAPASAPPSSAAL